MTNESEAALVMVDTEDTAFTLSLSSFSLLSKLAGLSATANISAISLSPDSQTCLVSFSNNRLVELNTNTGKSTKFSREEAVKLPKSWLARRTPVTDIVHLAGNPDLILLKDHEILAVLDKDKQMPEPSSKLYFTDPRATPDTDSVSVSSLGSKLDQAMASGLRMSRKYEHLVSLHHLAGDELVAVEVKPSLIESQLPPSLKQKKFGVL